MRLILTVTAVCLATPKLAADPSFRPARFQPVVEIEEDVYERQPLNNGSGPMWCSGSTCLVRIGDRVFASGMEKLPDAQPLNNSRWTLFERQVDGWRLLQSGAGRTREPSPLVGFPDGRLFLSANPTLVPASAQGGGPARPEILQFSASA